MLHVLTLVANPAVCTLSGCNIEAASTALPRPDRAHWLAPGIAADIPFEPDKAELDTLRAEVAAALDSAPLDFVMQPQAGRRKRLLVADMDSTMIEQEGIDELADALGLKDRIAAITERAMRGEIAFEPALRERVALLKGLERHVVETIAEQRITLTPGAVTLVRTMRANGAYTVLVSGGFTTFSSRVAERIGFNEHRANALIFDEQGSLTGQVVEPILGRAAKLQTLIELRTRFELAAGATMAVGDGANDLAMLAEAGIGVAFRAKPTVAAAAQARIDRADLTALLYIQGYRADELVA
jgi:phosphoserine phosphatase